MPQGSVFKVRKNLRNALRSLRDAKSDCYVWIDAVCINQSSNAERNHQVKLMAAIYGNANVVVVWLESNGEYANVKKAFEFIHAATTYNILNTSVRDYCVALRPARKSWKEDWLSVIDLCNLRYWSRKWVSFVRK
jgi:hypothetical protein